MSLTLRFAAVSDIGRSRKKNDDSGYAGPHFLMVADGMGGAPAGDLASAVAVQTMRRLDEPAPADLTEALAGAVHRANDRLAELISADSSVEGMGTTVSAVLFDGQRIGVAHLGDSRGYLWRDGELLRITHDHSWVQSLIDEGRLTEDEAKVHSHRSLLLKVLDGRHDNDPDLTVYDVEAGDRILLCSDGLSGFVEHDRIQRVLAIGTAESVASELVQLALEAASTDNITVVVADVVDEVGETGELPVIPADGPEPLALPGDAAPAAGDGAAAGDGGGSTRGSNVPVVVGSAAEPPRGPLSRLRTWTLRDDAERGKTLLDEDVDPEQMRYAPRAPLRFLWLRRALVVAVLLAVAAGAAAIAYAWSQQQYYVAPAGDQVAIYKGVQSSLPGLALHSVYESQPLALSELPSYRRSQVVEGMEAHNLDDARAIVAALEGFATACAQQSTATHTQTETAPTQTPASHSSGPSTTLRSPGTSTSSRPRPQHPASTRARQALRRPPASTTRGPSPQTAPHRSSASTPATTAGSPSPSSPATPGSSARDPSHSGSPVECAGATVAAP